MFRLHGFIFGKVINASSLFYEFDTLSAEYQIRKVSFDQDLGLGLVEDVSDFFYKFRLLWFC